VGGSPEHSRKNEREVDRRGLVFAHGESARERITFGQMTVTAHGLTRVTAAASALFSCALFWAAFRFESDLALAQASDSLLDLTGAIVLAWVVNVAREPGDERHPMGHTRAEPLGALLIALLAGVLALEVGSSAVASLLEGAEMIPSFLLVGFFAGKVLFKAAVWRLAD
jgi:divalent metal cation (Fe/Co/Zn/Cd) transporter